MTRRLPARVIRDFKIGRLRTTATVVHDRETGSRCTAHAQLHTVRCPSCVVSGYYCIGVFLRRHDYVSIFPGPFPTFCFLDFIPISTNL